MIESEGKEVFCPRKLKVPKKVCKGRTWKRVEDTNIYTFSSYYDLRLEPYKYVRVIAMIKGEYMLRCIKA